jgi:hypothetical protein
LNSCSSCTRRHDLLDRDAELPGEVHLLLLGVRQELVQRRIEEADGGREALQRLEDAEEVLALVRQELRQGGFCGPASVSARIISRIGVDAVALEEHVLGAGEADAVGAERDGLGGLLRGVGVGAHGRRVAFEHQSISWT